MSIQVSCVCSSEGEIRDSGLWILGTGFTHGQHERPVEVLWEVWTNVLLQISKISVIRNSFLFSLLPSEVFFMPHVHSIHSIPFAVVLCFIRLLYIQSDVLWGIRCCRCPVFLRPCAKMSISRLRCVPKTISFIIYGRFSAVGLMGDEIGNGIAG